MPKIYRDNPKDIARVARLLREGSLVALPTETVYGLAANTFNPGACRRIFEIKGRPLIDPLIVHINTWAQAYLLALMNASAEKLAKVFWPGPLTLILPKKDCVPNIVTASLPTVALRMPSHPMMMKVLAQSECPLAAPSANPFGYVSPTQAKHVIRMLGTDLNHILDGGKCKYGIESTVVDLSDQLNPRILRLGAITEEEINGCLGVNVPRVSSLNCKQGTKSLPSPGLMGKHYSPNAKLELFKGEELPVKDKTKKTATIFFQRHHTFERKRLSDCFWLCEDGNPKTAAQHLFDLLQQLDQENYEVIAVELAPEKGIGAAINDRLQRAAVNH